MCELFYAMKALTRPSKKSPGAQTQTHYALKGCHSE